MKIKFIKQVDHIEAGTVRDFLPKLAEQLIEGGYAEAYSEKEDKPAVKRETKELKTARKTK